MTSEMIPSQEQAAWMHRCIEDFATSGENRLNESNQEPAWARPLVGFSRGDDPPYKKIKNGIGAFYWTPREHAENASSDARRERSRERGTTRKNV